MLFGAHSAATVLQRSDGMTPVATTSTRQPDRVHRAARPRFDVDEMRKSAKARTFAGGRCRDG